MPIRYQSDDGGCVIDVRPRKKGSALRNEVARNIDISDTAQRVIQRCVVDYRAKSGGSTFGFSTSKFTRSLPDQNTLQFLPD